jgi:hypothetical protein
VRSALSTLDRRRPAPDEIAGPGPPATSHKRSHLRALRRQSTAGRLRSPA